MFRRQLALIGSIAALLAPLGVATPAAAAASQIMGVSGTCGSGTPTPILGGYVYVLVNSHGEICTNSSGGGGGGIVTNAGAFAVQNTAATPAGAAIIGKVGIDQTTPGTTNGVQTLTGSTTVVTGNVAMTKADGADVTMGAKADAKSTATDTTAITVMQVLKEISAMVQAPPSQAVTATLQTQTDTVMVGGFNIKEAGGGAITIAAHGTNSAGAGIITIQPTCEFDDVSPTAITENQLGNSRCSANRNGYMTIRDAAGNERGVNVDASGNMDVVLGGGLENSSVKASAASTGAIVMSYARPSGGAAGVTPCRIVTGTTGFCKASAATIYSCTIYNANAAVRYFHIYNKASAPTLNTDTPVYTRSLLGASQIDITFAADIGMSVSNGFAWSYTTDDVAVPVTAGTSTDLHATCTYN